MTGSNLFSFTTTRRKSKPHVDTLSNPSGPADIRHMHIHAADDLSRTPHAARGRQAKQHPSNRASLASTKNYNTENQFILTASPGPGSLHKSPPKADQSTDCFTVPDLHLSQLRKEESSCTLASHYDRRKSPLVVSQQTSASSARDFALRKGYPPIIPASDAVVPCLPDPESTLLLNREAPKKRPSRLDFSMLLPKPSSRSGPLLSPNRYTNSPRPLSPTTEPLFHDHQLQSFLHDNDSGEARKLGSPHHAQDPCLPSKLMDPSFAKAIPQGSRLRVRNWFHGWKGDVMENEADGKFDLQAAVAKTRFQTTHTSTSSDIASPPAYQAGVPVRPDQGTRRQFLGVRKTTNPPEAQSVEDLEPPGTSYIWQGMPKDAVGGARNRVSRSQRSESITLDFADLHEESVLCLSESDNEDENPQNQGQGSIIEQREPFLRDSLIVESIYSKVEVGTAQAVTTSSLRAIKMLPRTRDLQDNPSTKTQAKMHRLKAVEIPDRRSSRQGAAGSEREMISRGSDDGFFKASSGARSAQASLSSRSSSKAPATLISETKSMLIMALTPQEASLLEAMRAKKAVMDQDVVPEGRRGTADEVLPFKSNSVLHPRDGHCLPPSSIYKTPTHENAELLDAKKYSLAHPVSTYSGLTSVEMSLMFSDGVSSPTTSRPSPTTPTLDSSQELSFFHGLGDSHISGSHAAKASHPGHIRCNTGSSQLILHESFAQPQEDSMASDQYPWMFGPSDESVNTMMVH